MNAAQGLRSPTSQQLCVFCAARTWTEAHLGSRSSLRRRRLHSSPSASRPPGAATALRQDDDDDDGNAPYSNPSYSSPPENTGWGRNFRRGGLTSEEQHERQALRKRLAPSTTGQSHTRAEGSPRSQGSEPASRFSISRSSGRPLPVDAVPNTGQGSQQSTKLPFRIDSRRPSAAPSRGNAIGLQHVNHREAINPNANTALNEPGPQAHTGTTSQLTSATPHRELPAGWRHFKRREADQPGEGNVANLLGAKAQTAYETERLQREEEAKAGKFVGFKNNTPVETVRPDDRSGGTNVAWTPSHLKKGFDKHNFDRQYYLGKTRQPLELSKSPVGQGNYGRGGKDENADATSHQIPNPDARWIEPPERAELATKWETQRRRESKFAHPEPYQSSSAREHPRGRGRDKSRRRNQFVSEHQDEEEDEAASRADRKRQRKKDKAARKAVAPPTPISIPEFISVENLARILKVKTEDFGQKLRELGFEESNHDHILNAENAGLIAMEYNHEPILEKSEDDELRARPEAEDKTSLPLRPPVVTIMGHVDHGKTTLLDWLRKSAVAASEHGGITQHIGAFSVPMQSGKVITFLDTPGHAAFLSMRQRGATVTDIVILVVAADDSVKPQTIEAIRHAKAARVPIIVAINKIDKPESDAQRVKQDLARHGVEVEDFGGDTQAVYVSGKTGEGMEELEEAAVTLSEILDMRAERDGQGEGWVLEATTKKAGRVATVLVRRGTLHTGDVIVAGSTWARIRTLKNEAGVEIAAAGPGTPVEVDGWREQPSAGDEVLQAPDEAKAKSVVHYRSVRAERLRMAADMEAVNESRRLEQLKREREERIAAGTLTQDGVTDDMLSSSSSPSSETGPKQIPFIVKADVSGSVEAVLNGLAALGNAEVRAHVLRSGVGPIGEFDIEHAAAAGGHLISFNTSVEPGMARMAQSAGVRILDHSIIYRLVDDVQAKLSEYLAPLVTQRVLGEAEVAQVFDITIKGRTTKPVAGCKIRNGVVGKNARVRVMRGEDKELVYDGTVSSLRSMKKDVNEMRKGTECGVGFGDEWVGFQVGDKVQTYEEVVQQRTL
ncbi:MAG: hypothetical protein M1837_002851 [Sclerophora amabilis]|nr:MAG: hypothetical protein M1837_002851 [Sclerophora amabilis]